MQILRSVFERENFDLPMTSTSKDVSFPSSDGIDPDRRFLAICQSRIPRSKSWKEK